jgi:hypothetical protein
MIDYLHVYLYKITSLVNNLIKSIYTKIYLNFCLYFESENKQIIK